MKKNKIPYKNYEYIFKMVMHESEFVWSTGNMFLFANTILVGFIGSNFVSLAKNYALVNVLFLISTSILGMVISFLWYFSVERIVKRLSYWMAKARLFEKKKMPFKIFSGASEKLANGEIKSVDGKKYDLKIWGLLHLPIQIALKLLIVSFIFFYLSTLIFVFIKLILFYFPTLFPVIIKCLRL